MLRYLQTQTVKKQIISDLKKYLKELPLYLVNNTLLIKNEKLNLLFRVLFIGSDLLSEVEPTDLDLPRRLLRCPDRFQIINFYFYFFNFLSFI
jgi:hypothetical protein